MAVKSIVEIDVQAESFDAFTKLFDDYRQHLAEMPGAWGKVGDAAAKTGSHFGEAVAALTAESEMLHHSELAAGKFGRALSTAGRSMHRLVADTRDVAAHIGKATVSLAKWTGIVGMVGGLVGAAGGLFGIDRLAANAYSMQRNASGFGITPGKKQAFDLDIGRVVDPSSFLGNIQDALTTPGGAWKFGAIGMPANERTGDTADTAVKALKRLKDLVDKTPDQLLGQGGVPGVSAFLSTQDAIRLKHTSPQDFQKYLQDFGADTKAFQVAARAFVDFSVQLERAKTLIEDIFINALTPLAPELSKLSNAFADAVKTFMATPQLKVWIDDLATGIKEFAGYVSTPKFDQDIKDFVENIGKIASAVKWLASWMPTSWAGAAAGAAAGAELGPLGIIAGGIIGGALGGQLGAPGSSSSDSGGVPNTPPASFSGSAVQFKFLRALATGEAKGYNQLTGGGSDVGLPTDATGFPIWSGVGNSHAAGLYQFQPDTWASEYKKLGLTGGMTAANQDLAALDLAATTYATNTGGRSIWADYAAGGYEEQISAALHGQWPSTGPKFVKALKSAMAAAKPHPAAPQATAAPPAKHAALTGRGLQVPAYQQASLTIYNQTGGSAIIAGSQLTVPA